MRIQLWQQPQPTTQRLRLIERLAIMGRRPASTTAAHLLGTVTLPASLHARRHASTTATAE